MGKEELTWLSRYGEGWKKSNSKTIELTKTQTSVISGPLFMQLTWSLISVWRRMWGSRAHRNPSIERDIIQYNETAMWECDSLRSRRRIENGKVLAYCRNGPLKISHRYYDETETGWFLNLFRVKPTKIPPTHFNKNCTDRRSMSDRQVFWKDRHPHKYLHG